MKIVGIIPCRYQSSRLPGKPLALINNRPMMWHTYQRALESGILDEVYIATDDLRIKEVADNYGLNVVVTHGEHLTGTDRVAEVSQYINADYYVNIQGDEPFINPDAIKMVSQEITKYSFESSIKAVNAYSILDNESDIIDPNVVKVITDIDFNVLAYSRYPIPYSRFDSTSHYRQLGLYAFTKEALNIFINNKPHDIEKSEGVEMYRIIENGYKVKMVITDDLSISVDTPEDLERVRRLTKE
jgi:3-deoxy-manno-octulosonate cytidylyltransferase (CMP-KDO synthetase)